MLQKILGRKHVCNHSGEINGLCFNTKNWTKITMKYIVLLDSNNIQLL